MTSGAPRANESPTFELFVGDYLLQELESQRGRDSFAHAAPDPKPVAATETHAVVFQLGSRRQWETFHRAFAGTPNASLAPWYRCLGILRGHNALSAVVEPHYVCLDWRSEVAAFYAFLDAPRRNAALRVHFFAETVTREQVDDLTPTQKASYLGYMVVREGGLPLVGRTVLKPPGELAEATISAVREPVHFYGQDLEVNGVPFMQQDAQFAVCAQIVAWMAHYTAFRRGILERRLIADFVTNSGRGVEPMRPAVREGMNLSQVMNLFGRMGLRSWTFETPWAATSGLPRMRRDRFPELAVELSALGLPDDGPAQDLTAAAEDMFSAYVESLDEGLPDVTEPAARVQDTVLAAVLRPYLDSRLTIYAGTADHALFVFGYTQDADHTIHWVHDDLWGPYLRADSLMLLSRDDLRFQSGLLRGRVGESYSQLPPTDRLRGYRPVSLVDPSRAIRGFAIPAPTRAILPPTVAQGHATSLLSDILSAAADSAVTGIARGEQSLAMGTLHTSLQMGIQFKGQRRAEALRRGDDTAVTAWSSMHLAEWVIVVQSVDGEDAVPWEMVYDGSSTTSPPRLQCVRIGKQMLSVNPVRPDVYDLARLNGGLWPVVSVPTRLAKYLESPPDAAPATT